MDRFHLGDALEHVVLDQKLIFFFFKNVRKKKILFIKLKSSFLPLLTLTTRHTTKIWIEIERSIVLNCLYTICSEEKNIKFTFAFDSNDDCWKKKRLLFNIERYVCTVAFNHEKIYW